MRRLKDVLAGLAAIAMLLLLIGGVPYALATFIGWPLPRELPRLSLETLRSPVDATTLGNILALLVWLAWAQFTACVIVEVKAAASGAGMPGKVPLGGFSQLLARQLVAAVLLLSSSAAGLAPGRVGIAAALGPQHRPPAVTVQVEARHAVADDATATRARAPAPGVRKVYVVQPPRGRHHESLWEIAERHLGDGRRYREIFELNKGREQPDGDRLSLASLIRPGWVLDMPADAVGVEILHEQATTGTPAPSTGGGAGAGAGSAATQAGGGAHVEAPAPRPIAHELAGATLLAAGLLTALGWRRRQQLWHRAFGGRVRRPRDEAAAAEEAIRLGADPEAARLLDLGLRSLSRGLAEAGRSLPTVYAARVSGRGLELLLAPAEPQAPEPWEAAANGSVWRLPAHAGAMLDDESLRDVLAPYPGLVTLGTDAGGHVLVDLESAYGVVALHGPAGRSREVLAAVAAELATNRWSDHMRITLVGFGDELELLAPERVRVAASLSQVLPELEARAEETARALAISGVDSVLTGRCRGVLGEAWMPHFLLVASQPEPRECERLARLGGVWQRTPMGYLVAGEVPGATWTWEVSREGRLSLPLLGLEVEAQRLPASSYNAVVELFRTAADLSTTGGPGPETAPGASLRGASLTDLQRPAAVELRLLGPVEVSAPGELEEGRAEACTEALVYLATHPEGVHPTVLGGAVWPRGVSPAVREATIARLRDWLGRDAEGRANLLIGEDGRLHLSAEVRSDWAVQETLLDLAGSSPAGEAAYLEQALALVRGPLLEGRRPRRYAWLAREDLEYEVPARIADAAHRLVDLRLAGGDAHGAVEAARAGLRGVPAEEGLWRDLLRATHATGETARLRAVVTELEERVAADSAMEELPAETEALVEELLPSWRLSVASSGTGGGPSAS